LKVKDETKIYGEVSYGRYPGRRKWRTCGHHHEASHLGRIMEAQGPLKTQFAIKWKFTFVSKMLKEGTIKFQVGMMI
jgi:hypothetical protein